MSTGKERKEAAAMLGRKGGEGRARNLSQDELRQIGQEAARKRWDAASDEERAAVGARLAAARAKKRARKPKKAKG